MSSCVSGLASCGLQRPSGLAAPNDDVLWTGLSRGETGDALENDDAVTSTGTFDVLNVGLMGTPGIDGDVAAVAVVGAAAVPNAAAAAVPVATLLNKSIGQQFRFF